MRKAMLVAVVLMVAAAFVGCKKDYPMDLTVKFTPAGTGTTYTATAANAAKDDSLKLTDQTAEKSEVITLADKDDKISGKATITGWVTGQKLTITCLDKDDKEVGTKVEITDGVEKTFEFKK